MRRAQRALEPVLLRSQARRHAISRISWPCGRRFRIQAESSRLHHREWLAAVAEDPTTGAEFPSSLLLCGNRVYVRHAGDDRQRQRDRANQQRHSRLGRSYPSSPPLRCAWHRRAECPRRELQRRSADSSETVKRSLTFRPHCLLFRNLDMARVRNGVRPQMKQDWAGTNSKSSRFAQTSQPGRMFAIEHVAEYRHFIW